MVFNAIESYCDGQCNYSCLPEVLLTSTLHNILSKPLAAFPHHHCRNNGQRSVAITIISLRIEFWPSRESNPRPPVFKSATLPTNLCGSAFELKLYIGQRDKSFAVLPPRIDNSNSIIVWSILICYGAVTFLKRLVTQSYLCYCT